MNIAFILGFLLVTLLVVYFRPKLLVWTLATFIYLIVMHIAFEPSISGLVFWLFGLIFAVIAVVFNLKPIRLILTRIVYAKAKGVLPGISDTEKLALDAGDPWFEKDIFQGEPDFAKLHSIKKFELNAEEQAFYDNQTTNLCKMIDDWQIVNKDHDLSVEAWNYIREQGFFGLVIPKEYDGHGFSASAHSEIVMKIATRSATAAVTVMVPNSLGPGELLLHYGTNEQKNYYLPRLAKGQEIPCFALTGPTAGSDATSIPDKGTVCMGEYEGKQVLGIKLENVDKRYITLAPVATLVGLAFKLFDPQGLLKGVGNEGITCALLPHDLKGLEVGNRLYPMNQPFMNGTVRIKDAFIPIDWIIGGQKMAGEGWRMLVECLSIGRSISLPACGNANGLFSAVLTSAYALIREQFKTPIGHFEGVEEALAKIGGLAYLMNATREFTVTAVDSGIKPSVASAISKYHLTENGRIAVNHAMDVHAGRAVISGPHNYISSAYQAIPIGITVEGANIMTRNLMIFGQGAMRCHPYVRAEYESLTSANGLEQFDKAMFGHIGYYGKNKLHAVFHGLTAGLFAKGYDSKFSKYYKRISRLSSAFAFINDSALILLGGELKTKERLSARLGDAMSYLYMGCATLKYFKDQGERQSDEVFIAWSLSHAIFNAQNALIDALDNFSMPIIGKILKTMIFPYGRSYRKPSDNAERRLVKALLSNCETREVFRSKCYIPEDYTDRVGRMEVAFKAVLETMPIRAKLRQAVKAKQLPKASIEKLVVKARELDIITDADVAKFDHAHKLVNEVIQVDEFAPFELGPKNAHPDWS